MSIIRDPSSGKAVNVSDDGQLLTQGEAQTPEHYTSHTHGQVFQVRGEATVSSGTTQILHVSNNSSSKKLTIFALEIHIVDAAGGTALPNASSYFEIGFGTSYTSGGTLTGIPVNLNRSSGNTADTTSYEGDPTVGGTFLPIDKFFPTAEGAASHRDYLKQGAIILGQDDTVSIRYVGDQTAGLAYASFVFIQD